MRKIHPYISEYLNGKKINCNEVIDKMLHAEEVPKEFNRSDEFIKGFEDAVDVLIKGLLFDQGMELNTVLNIVTTVEKDEKQLTSKG